MTSLSRGRHRLWEDLPPTPLSFLTTTWSHSHLRDEATSPQRANPPAGVNRPPLRKMSWESMGGGWEGPPSRAQAITHAHTHTHTHLLGLKLYSCLMSPVAILFFKMIPNTFSLTEALNTPPPLPPTPPESYRSAPGGPSGFDPSRLRQYEQQRDSRDVCTYVNEK